MPRSTNGVMGHACQKNRDVTEVLIHTIKNGGGPEITDAILEQGSDHGRQVERKEPLE